MSISDFFLDINLLIIYIYGGAWYVFFMFMIPYILSDTKIYA